MPYQAQASLTNLLNQVHILQTISALICRLVIFKNLEYAFGIDHDDCILSHVEGHGIETFSERSDSNGTQSIVVLAF